MNLNDIKFKGQFRIYQQRVLDSADKYLKDGKINIVAAPGSGKTILGLELIRRLASPCLVLSPTTTIRQQWGERFKESFLINFADVDDYVSYDLNNIKFINSITYQALYSVINKVQATSEEEIIDYSNIDLFKLINQHNIKTICLDEAHHLQNEWQKALEKFIKGLNSDIKIISLTATPPYDATPVEWDRYISVSGEIDDEIFVPELVNEKTLCPHQDYIVFNYPTEEETKTFTEHRYKANRAIADILKLEVLNDVNLKLEELHKYNSDYIYANFKFVVAIYTLLHYAGIQVNVKKFKSLTGTKDFPRLSLAYAEFSIQFLLDSSEFLDEEEKNGIIKILKENSLFIRNKVRLNLNDKLKKSLVSSCGKLNSISKIVELENEVLNQDLRMLILTDYIKKEEITNIGKDVNINNISVVSIFEKIRKNNNVSIGCLTGSLVILPKELDNVLLEKYDVEFKKTPLDNTNYCIYNFKGNNKVKVDIVSKLFEDGNVNVLIGTQALLGEGWDSPCINSLILASYVGSFMLSNQMRGRAIRTYKKNKDKTSNIWHLVTIEPDYLFKDNSIDQALGKIHEDKNVINSCDYDTLCRRFECFVGPNYETNEIESGIERISFIKPPYSRQTFAEINQKTFNLAKNRDHINDCWSSKVDKKCKTIIENRVPKDFKVPAMTFHNVLLLGLATSIISACTVISTQVLKNSIGNDFSPIVILIMTSIIVFIVSKSYKIVEFICRHISPSKSLVSLGKVILKTLQELEFIHDGAKVVIKEDDYKINTFIGIKNATIHEQNIFNKAIQELLEPIENPKYIIIKKKAFNKYDYKYSFNCPTIFSKKNEYVTVLKDNLKKAIGNIDIKYVYNEEGRALMVKARKNSFVTKVAKEIKKIQKLSRYE